MDWSRDLKDWPLSTLSRQVRVSPHVWHVQETGEGPTVLLLHGAGGSTHSWARLIPLLANHHHVVAIDLPGQGFTRAGTKTRCGLETMSTDIHALINDQGWQPSLIIGHSAGGALALNLAGLQDHPPGVVGINAALAGFDGIAGWLFPMLAKMMVINPFTAVALTMGGASLSRTQGLIRTTGSVIDDDSLRCYATLFADRGHVDSTLQMMARWDVDQLSERLFTVETPTLLLAGSQDGTVPPNVSERAASTMPNARYEVLEGFGHLAHEEDPEAVAKIIVDWQKAF